MARVRQTYLSRVLGTDKYGAGTFRLKLKGGHEQGSPLMDEETAKYCETYNCGDLKDLYERSKAYFATEQSGQSIPSNIVHSTIVIITIQKY